MVSTLLLALLLAPSTANAEGEATANTATGATPQSLRLTVVAPSAMRSMRLRATTTWLGQERSLDLLDDGSQPGDVAGDGLWTGEWTGGAVTALALRIEVRANAESEPVTAYQGTETVLGLDDSLAWRLHLGPPIRAERTALPRAPAQVSRDATLQVIAAAGWSFLLLNYVGWLLVPVLRRKRDAETQDPPRADPPRATSP